MSSRGEGVRLSRKPRALEEFPPVVVVVVVVVTVRVTSTSSKSLL